MKYYLMILGTILLDQLTKVWIRTNLAISDSIVIIDGLFAITHIENKGAAFSMLAGRRLFLILLPLATVVIILIAIYIYRKEYHPLLLTSMALIAGGGIGNLIDRMYFGVVTDFFDLEYFAIFNVADIFVCVGGFLIAIWAIFIDVKQKGKKDGIDN